MKKTLKSIVRMYESEDRGSSEHPSEYFDEGEELRELADGVDDVRLKKILNNMANYAKYDAKGSAEHIFDFVSDSDYKYLKSLLETM